MAYSISGNITLCWLSWPFRTWNALLQALLAFQVSTDKSAVFLKGFSFVCDVCVFSFSFQCSPLFCMLGVLTMDNAAESFFPSLVLSVGVLLCLYEYVFS